MQLTTEQFRKHLLVGAFNEAPGPVDKLWF